MEKLEQWYNQIKEYKQLTIKEAKELYLLAEENNDIMNEIITGTLYVIYNFLKNNGFYLLKDSTYDIEDIINSFCEEWIKVIKKGLLLTNNKYSTILNKAFISRALENALNDRASSNDKICLNNEEALFLYEIYLDLKKKNIDVNYHILVNEIAKRMYLDSSYFHIGKSVLRIVVYNGDLINLLDAAYKNFDLENSSCLLCNRTRINQLIPLFIRSGLYERISSNIESEYSTEEIVLNEIYYKEIIDTIKEEIDNKRQLDILLKTFGVEENKVPIRLIAEEYKISKERVNIINRRSFNQLKRSKSLKRKVY